MIPEVVAPIPSLRTGAERKFVMPTQCPACGQPVYSADYDPRLGYVTRFVADSCGRTPLCVVSDCRSSYEVLSFEPLDAK